MWLQGLARITKRSALVLKSSTLVLTAVAFAVAACDTPPPPPPQIAAAERGIGPAYGIDLATDASDVLNELKGSRINFVARYYRHPASRWPPLTASEAQRLSAMGIKIVAVWEPYRSYDGYFNYTSGYYDALAAFRQAQAVGQPKGTAIYFAVDFDARSLPPIGEYFRGINAGMAAASGGRPAYQIGVYGSGAVCEAVKGAGLAQYAWLTNASAWAGTPGYSAWDIRQGGRLSELAVNHDADEARDEFGAFRIADQAMPPFPPAPPTSQPAEGGAPPWKWLTSLSPL